MSRSEVIGFFWPTEEEPTARRRLNQLLYALKKKGPGASLVLASADGVLSRNPAIPSDLQTFEQSLERADFSTCVGLLEQGFLRLVRVRSAERVADWAHSRALDLRTRLTTRAEERWEDCCRAQDWERAVSAAEALLAISPADEGCLGRVMEAWGKQGRPMQAKASMERFSERHQREFQTRWTPTRKTLALAERLENLPTDLPETTAPNPPPEAPKPPLLGRDEQRGTLRKTLGDIPTRGLRAILLSGEAGIGKTRLIQEVLAGLPMDGQRVLLAGAADLEQLIPLNPLIEAFKEEAVGEVLRGLDEPWRSVLYGVMPFHYIGDRPIPEAPQIQPGSVPRRLFEAFYQLLLALSLSGPVVLVLEDLQWADHTTLAVLKFLIRRWDHGQLQFVGSVRSEEIRRNADLQQLLEDLQAHDDSFEVHLRAIDAPSSEALIDHLAPSPISQQDRFQLRALAGGNPFFLIELTLEFLSGRLPFDPQPQAILPIPVSIRQVLKRRLARLSADAEAVLGSLAVHGRSIDVVGLAHITQITESRCLAGLDQLYDFRLAVASGSEIVLSHELVRQTVYHGLSETRKTWLHGRVARHILQTKKDPPVDELAVHFHRARDGEKARVYATRAARHARESGAVAEALRFLSIAREHTDDPMEIAGLVEEMGRLNYQHQHLDEAAPLLEVAAQRLRRQDMVGRALRAEVERIDCLAQTDRLPLRECLEELQRIKEEARASQEWETFMRALDVEAHLHDRLGDLTGARRVLELARVKKEIGTKEARCRALNLLALNIYFGCPEDGMAAAREAVAIGRTVSDRDLFLATLNRFIIVLHYQGILHWKEGQEAQHQAEQEFAHCGDLNLKFLVRLNSAVWHLEVGRLDHARNAFQKLERAFQGAAVRDNRIRLFLNLGELGILSQDTQAARAAFSKAASLITPSSNHSFHVIATAGIGLSAFHEGSLAEAREMEADLPSDPTFWTYDPTLVTTFRAKMMIMRREQEKAIELMEEVRGSVQKRLVTAWLRLTLEQARILRRMDKEESKRLAREGLRVSTSLRLDERRRAFERML